MSAFDKFFGAEDPAPPPSSTPAATSPGSEGYSAIKQPWWQDNAKWPFVAVGLVVVFLLWQSGMFDHALVNVGLNYHDCARNGFGAVFCGDDLTQYRESIGQ